jgi:DNA processing protein
MKYQILLAHFPKFTYRRYKKLYSFFKDAQQIWEADLAELIQSRIEEHIADEFISWRKCIDPEKLLLAMDRENIKTVSIGQTDYPALLAEINDPPYTLFFRGTLPKRTAPSIAIVGTRSFSMYGKQACETITHELADQGLLIISGLALGIDGIAHTTTLEAAGTTLAVLGSGIDHTHIYPTHHQALAERIIVQGGALLSEYPPGFMPTPYSFPMRNRIIAGLSLGTLIIEARKKSGALITAKCALDYNREVLAIPHPIFSTTGAGTNQLIQQGATLITCTADIITALNLPERTMLLTHQEMLPTNAEEQQILATMSHEPQHINTIIKQTKLLSSVVNATLVLLEMKGRVKNTGGMNYVLK